jgi:phenazine biosynthesis protein PhzF family
MIVLVQSKCKKLRIGYIYQKLPSVCKPNNDGADYRLRIFPPHNELPFAGHPTIGSAQAVLNEGLTPKHKGYIVQECEKGLIKIYIKNDELFLTITTAEKVDVGAVWYTLEIKDAKQVLQLTPDMSELSKAIPSGVTGITIFGKYSEGTSTSDFEVRSFAPNEGADEDPVCGSGNGCVAVLVKKYALVNQDTYSVSQGSRLGRNGKVKVEIPQTGPILLGGKAVAYINGKITI